MMFDNFSYLFFACVMQQLEPPSFLLLLLQLQLLLPPQLMIELAEQLRFSIPAKHHFGLCT